MTKLQEMWTLQRGKCKKEMQLTGFIVSDINTVTTCVLGLASATLTLQLLLFWTSFFFLCFGFSLLSCSMFLSFPRICQGSVKKKNSCFFQCFPCFFSTEARVGGSVNSSHTNSLSDVLRASECAETTRFFFAIATANVYRRPHITASPGTLSNKEPFIRKAPDTCNFLRHLMRLVWLKDVFVKGRLLDFELFLVWQQKPCKQNLWWYLLSHLKAMAAIHTPRRKNVSKAPFSKNTL